MSTEIAALKKRIAEQEERITRLRREKANLQMAVRLINQVTDVTGSRGVVSHVLEVLVSALGGSNIAVYYETAGRWHYTDSLGNNRWMDRLDDPLVSRCVETRSFVKEKDEEESELTLPGFERDYEIWVYPLIVSGSMFGAVRLQGMAIEHAHYRTNIDPFIQYTALALYHEVTNIKNLTEAYGKVEKARQELAVSKERFELAMKFANEGLFDWDLQRSEIYYSPVWKSLLGYADHEIKNDFSEWERLTRPEDVERSWNMLKEVLDGTKEGFEIEFQMRHKDGHWVDILSRANVIFDTDGKGQRVVGTHVDISRLRQMEKEVRESEIKYRSIMESTKDPTYICSEDYHIEYINPAMLEWLGEDCTGKRCYTALHGLKEPCPWCSFTQVLEQEAVSQEFISPRDNRKYVSSNSPIIHEDGTISKLTVYHDVTELMEMEARLQRAQKMESIGYLAGGIAHDFNNILYPIIGMSELLIEDVKAGSHEHDSLNEILTAGKRGADLVKQILTFSRQEEHHKHPIDLQQVLGEVLKLCRATIPTNVKINQRISVDCGRINADPVQIHQVVMNLITNAYHAVESVDGEITVSLKEVYLEEDEVPSNALEAGRYALVSVSDTGTGIDKTLVDTIFDPYFTTKEQGKGTGLGLATVYGITKEHDGDIKVYTELGVGTTFNVYLPITGAREQRVPAEPRQDLPRGDEHVLVIDDEPAVTKLQTRRLERLGYRVTSLNSSTEALDLFRSNPDRFAIVITDMTMPGMTGDKLTSEIKAIRPDVPVIICTGFSERIDLDSSTKIGVEAFLMKPVTAEELSQSVRQALGDPSSG